MPKPIISVIVPTHVRSILLKRALSSINLQFLREHIEVIVISDARDSATDQICHEMLSSSDMYIIRNGEAGPSESRNIGLKLAHGQYIMFLDDDDAWCPEFTSELNHYLEKLTSTISYFNCTIVKESRTPQGAVIHSENQFDWANMVNDQIYVKNQVHMSCLLFPRNILDGLEFDRTMRAYEDWDFVLAARDVSPIRHVPVMCSRIHEVDDHTTDRRGNSAGAVNFNAVLDYLYVYRRHAAPDRQIAELRQVLLASTGLTLPPDMV